MATPVAQGVQPEPTQATARTEPIIGGLTAGGDSFEITLVDDVCTVAGPARPQAGTHTFVFLDLDEDGSDPQLNVVELTDGHTWDELVDSVAGHGLDASPRPRPAWVVDTDGKPDVAFRYQQDNELPDDARVHAYDLAPGPHAIVAFDFDPPGLWLCAPFEVSPET